MLRIMNKMEEIVIITTTTGSSEEAESLSRGLLEARLAACVQISPAKSAYWWKGSIESANELVLTAKTKKSLADRVIAFVKDNHSYEVPEIIVTPVSDGNEKYLEWVRNECEPGK